MKADAPLMVFGFFFFAVVIAFSRISDTFQHKIADDSALSTVFTIILLSSIALSFFFVFSHNYWKVGPSGLVCFYSAIIPHKRISKDSIQMIFMGNSNKKFLLAIVMSDGSSLKLLEDTDMYKVEMTGEKIAEILDIQFDKKVKSSTCGSPDSEKETNYQQAAHTESEIQGTEIPFYMINKVEDSLHLCHEAAVNLEIVKTSDGYVLVTPTKLVKSVWKSQSAGNFGCLIILTVLSGLLALFGLYGLYESYQNQDKSILSFVVPVFLISSVLALIFSYCTKKFSDRYRKKIITFELKTDRLIVSGAGMPPSTFPFSSIMELEAVMTDEIEMPSRYSQRTDTDAVKGYLAIKTKEHLYSIEDIDFSVAQILEKEIKASVKEMKKSS